MFKFPEWNDKMVYYLSHDILATFSQLSHISLTKDCRDPLNTFVVWVYWRTLKISWSEHSTNNEVLQGMNTNKHSRNVTSSDGHVLPSS